MVYIDLIANFIIFTVILYATPLLLIRLAFL
jgi:hypothetical protein